MSKIVNYLKMYNEWRRGSEPLEQPNPYELGVMIDKAIARLEELEAITEEKVERVAEVVKLNHIVYGLGDFTSERRSEFYSIAAKEAIQAAIGGDDE